MQEYRIIEAFGITVLPVASLTRKAVLVDGQDVALIRPDLDEDDRDQVADWLLDRALHRTLQYRR